MVASKFHEVLDDTPASSHNVSLEDILAENRSRAASHGSTTSASSGGAVSASDRTPTTPTTTRSESTRQKFRRFTRGEKSR